MSQTTPSDGRPASGQAPENEPPSPAAPLRLDGAFARREREDWLRAAEKGLPEGVTLDAPSRRTLDGLPLDVLHDDSPVDGRRTPDSVTSAPLARRGWDNRLAVTGAGPDEANAHALAGLAGGVDSLELHVSGEGRTSGPAGDESTASARLPLDALGETLHGVHLNMITVSLRAADGTDEALDALLALYLARELDTSEMRADLDGDPLATLAREGAAADGLEGWLDDALERLAGTAVRAAAELPLALVARADMTVHHEAGASPVQELVAGIAAATLMLERLGDAGLAPEALCRAIGFRVSVEADIVGEVVKLRALERLWRHVLATSGLPVRAPHVIAETSRRQQSALAPWVNHLRNVAAGTAAAIGDADVLLVHPHDLVDGRRIGEQAEIADRVARNLPVLLAEEGRLRDVADAAGGAYAIESLTQATVEAVWHELGELQAAGGLVAALASGRWQEALGRSHAIRLARLQTGERVRVGVNRFRHADDGPVATGDGSGDGTADRDGAAGDGTSAERAERGRETGQSTFIRPLRAVREAREFERADETECTP